MGRVLSVLGLGKWVSVDDGGPEDMEEDTENLLYATWEGLL
jgi:hypothetical protein